MLNIINFELFFYIGKSEIIIKFLLKNFCFKESSIFFLTAFYLPIGSNKSRGDSYAIKLIERMVKLFNTEFIQI